MSRSMLYLQNIVVERSEAIVLRKMGGRQNVVLLRLRGPGKALSAWGGGGAKREKAKRPDIMRTKCADMHCF